jgi:hypothetical protein
LPATLVAPAVPADEIIDVPPAAVLPATAELPPGAIDEATVV